MTVASLPLLLRSRPSSTRCPFLLHTSIVSFVCVFAVREERCAADRCKRPVNQLPLEPLDAIQCPRDTEWREVCLPGGAKVEWQSTAFVDTLSGTDIKLQRLMPCWQSDYLCAPSLPVRIFPTRGRSDNEFTKQALTNGYPSRRSTRHTCQQ